MERVSLGTEGEGSVLLKIRAFDKNPRAYFLDQNGKRVIVTEAEVRDGKLEILKVIPEGKKEILFAQYAEQNKLSGM